MTDNALFYTPEQEQLRQNVRAFLEETNPSSRLRSLMNSELGFDRSVWLRMAKELELQSLSVPEEFGGAGFGLAELAIVVEELGRSLYSGPFFSSCVMAAQLLVATGDEAACRTWLPRIASGEIIATVGVVEDSGSWDPMAATLSCARRGDRWYLDGHKSYVLNAEGADVCFVTAKSPDGGVSLFAVEAGAKGFLTRRLPTLDLTRRQARLEFDDVKAELVGEAGGAHAAVQTMLNVARIALAAEQLGGARNCLEMSVEYAKLRHQFGRPIGSFQAIKHKCVDMLVKVESSQTAVMFASQLPDHSDELETAACVAQGYCGEAYFWCAAETIQIHGGIGFTWEHDAHLYFRRAKSTDLYLGDGAAHRARLAALITSKKAEVKDGARR